MNTRYTANEYEGHVPEVNSDDVEQDKKSNTRIYQWKKSRFHVSTDQNELDINFIHHFLTQSHWARGIDRKTVVMSIKRSLCFGVYRGSRQIGFARVITDYCTFAYLSDVFMLSEYRGNGLGLWLVQCCMNHPVMNGLRRIMLYTSCAPWLYAKAGFQPINQENVVWAITRPDIYRQYEKKVLKLIH